MGRPRSNTREAVSVDVVIRLPLMIRDALAERRRFGYGILAAFAATVVVVHLLQVPHVWQASLAIAVLYIPILGLWYLSAWLGAFRWHRRAAVRGEVRYRFLAQEIEAIELATGVSHRCAYDLSARETPTHFLFSPDGLSYFLIPKRNLDDAVIAVLRKRIGIRRADRRKQL